MKKKLFASITATIFLMTLIAFSIPVRAADHTDPDIEIAIIGPHGWIQWDGLWEGANLVADELNAHGGIKDAAGNGHDIVLYPLDEHAVPVPAPEVAITEILDTLTAHPGIKTMIGGFRTECVLPIREEIMNFAAANGRPIWIVAGAATDEIISVVQGDYERYKYMFRATPNNGSNLFATILDAVGDMVVPKLSTIFGSPVETAIVAEALSWCEGIVTGLQGYLKYKGCHVAKTILVSSLETDFSGTFATINALDVKLVIHLFSAVAGAAYIQYYGETEQEVASFGINVESQTVEFYESIGGRCEYETHLVTMGSVVAKYSPANPFVKPFNTKQFWYNYTEEYEHGPIYTSWGMADVIASMNETAGGHCGTNAWLGTDGQYVAVDDRIQIMEQYERDGLSGVFKFTGPNGKYHDVFVKPSCKTPFWPAAGPGHGDNPDLGYVRAHAGQWIDGETQTVYPSGKGPDEDGPTLPAGRKWRVPPRMYILAEADWWNGTDAVPDGVVDLNDLALIETYYGEAEIPWKYINGDMDNNNYFDINDATRVALDVGKSVSLPLS